MLLIQRLKSPGGWEPVRFRDLGTSSVTVSQQSGVSHCVPTVPQAHTHTHPPPALWKHLSLFLEEEEEEERPSLSLHLHLPHSLYHSLSHQTHLLHSLSLSRSPSFAPPSLPVQEEFSSLTPVSLGLTAAEDGCSDFHTAHPDALLPRTW